MNGSCVLFYWMEIGFFKMIFLAAATERIIARSTCVQSWSIWAEQGCILHFQFIFVATLLYQMF